MRKCSICIPTFRRPEPLGMCLASLVGFLPDPRVGEVLVAVTGPSDGSVGYWARSLMEALRIRGVEVRLRDGFDGLLDAKEWFAEDASGDFLLLLDDDAVIGADYLELLENFNGPNCWGVGAVSGSLQTPLDVGHYSDWSPTPVPAPPVGTVCNRVRMDGDLVVIDDKHQVYMLDPARVYECEVLVGTALFIRRELLEVDRSFEAGKFYYEEYDFTYRLFREGYRLLYDSRHVAWHVRDENGGMRAVEDRDKAVNGRLFKEKWGL